MKRFPLLLIASFLFNNSSVAAQEQLLLATSTYNNLVSAVNLQTNKVLASITVGVNPHELVYLPGLHLAYIANKGIDHYPGNSISVVDTKQLKNIKTLWVGDNCSPHAISEYKGNIYFACSGTSELKRYNPRANKIDWSMSAGKEPHNILIDKNTNSAFISNYADNSVSQIDLTTKAVNTVPLNYKPEPLALSPTGMVWIGTHQGRVFVLDPKTHALLENLTLSINGSITDLKFTPDGKFAIVLSTERLINTTNKTFEFKKSQLSFVDLQLQKITRRVDLGGFMGIGFAISADGKKAYVAIPQTKAPNGILAQSLDTGMKSRLSDQILVINLENLRIINRMTVGTSPAHVIIGE